MTSLYKPGVLDYSGLPNKSFFRSFVAHFLCKWQHFCTCAWAMNFLIFFHHATYWTPKEHFPILASFRLDVLSCWLFKMSTLFILQNLLFKLTIAEPFRNLIFYLCVLADKWMSVVLWNRQRRRHSKCRRPVVFLANCDFYQGPCSQVRGKKLSSIY